MNMDKEKAGEIMQNIAGKAKTAWDKTPGVAKTFGAGFLASVLAMAAWNAMDGEHDYSVGEDLTYCEAITQLAHQAYEDENVQGDHVEGTVLIGDKTCKFSVGPQ